MRRYPGVLVERWPVEEFTYLDIAACALTTYAEREGLRDAHWSRSQASAGRRTIASPSRRAFPHIDCSRRLRLGHIFLDRYMPNEV